MTEGKKNKKQVNGSQIYNEISSRISKFQKKDINIPEINFSNQYKLNLNNYTDIFNNDFSFFNFKNDTSPYTFEPLEIKFIEDK